MSEAEKKWNTWDAIRVSIDKPHIHYSKESREAYKAALRREIEKQKAILLNDSSSYSLREAQRLDKILELLDTVEP